MQIPLNIEQAQHFITFFKGFMYWDNKPDINEYSVSVKNKMKEWLFLYITMKTKFSFSNIRNLSIIDGNVYNSDSYKNENQLALSLWIQFKRKWMTSWTCIRIPLINRKWLIVNEYQLQKIDACIIFLMTKTKATNSWRQLTRVKHSLVT